MDRVTAVQLPLNSLQMKYMKIYIDVIALCA